MRPALLSLSLSLRLRLTLTLTRFGTLPRRQRLLPAPGASAALSALALALAGCAGGLSPTLGPSADLDLANPYVLNEIAVAGVQRGDLHTAWLLLERAARLAPHDERIVNNLEALRAARSGTPLPPRRAEASAPAVAPPPPPIWAAP